MERSITLRMRRLAVRVRWAHGLGGWADAMALLAVAAAVGLLLGRLFGHAPRFEALAAVLLLGPVAWGIRRALATGVGAQSQAAFLDRLFGLKGLLLAGLERPADEWDDVLRARLAASDAVLPRVRLRGLARRVLPPWLLLAAVFLLPAPPPAGAALHPHLAASLDDLEEDLELALEQGAIEAKRGEELRGRVKELREDLDRPGAPVSWNDVDAVAAKLAHELALHASRADSTRAALAALAAKARADGADQEALSKEAAALLRKAADAGHLAAVPEELLRELGVDRASGALPGGLSAEDLARLAQAMADALEGDAAAFETGPPGGDPVALEDLRALLAGEFAPDHEHGPG